KVEFRRTGVAMNFVEIVEWAGKVLELAGILTILVGAVTALWPLRNATRESGRAMMQYRRGLAQAILLGLEFLVAADIIRTVAVSPTFANVGVLAAIVLIRTFLSMTLELEITGRWPWQTNKSEESVVAGR